MTDEPEILFERRGALGLITLNRPKALNALTHDMCVAMTAQLDAWATDHIIRTVAIQGTGEKAFCAGGDIRAIYQSGKDGDDYARRFWHDEYILNSRIKHYPKPYVALLGGIVMGGGVGVSVHGSHRIADESIVFAMPETGIGMIPDVGGSYFLSRMQGELGLYLALTSARLKTADCLYADVADAFVPRAQWPALLERLAAGTDPDEALDGLSQDPGAATLPAIASAIEAVFCQDSVEAIVAALTAEHRDWAIAAYGAVQTKSPTSLKLTLRQLREGKRLDFNDCMRMEYRLVNRILKGHDFYEGVRATLLDKDGAPKWSPAKLEDVTEPVLAGYFAPLDQELGL